jgi:hypothetical protein
MKRVHDILLTPRPGATARIHLVDADLPDSIPDDWVKLEETASSISAIENSSLQEGDTDKFLQRLSS